jgi:hypothetical protein
MEQARRRRVLPLLTAGLAAAATLAGTAAASTPALGASTAARMPARPAATAPVRLTAPAVARTAAPRLKLIRAKQNVQAQRFGKEVFLDPGIYVASLGAPFQINVQRTKYTRPVTVTQVITRPNGTTRDRRLPRWTRDRWNGLRDFYRLTVRNSAGKVVSSRKMTFCPAGYDPQRTGANSATNSLFPQGCGNFEPFPKGMVWGIARGWAVDPADFDGLNLKLALGKYTVTETVFPAYRRLLHIAWRDAKQVVTVHVVKGTDCCFDGPQRHPAQGKPLPSLPRVATLHNPSRSALPDLVALPSWELRTAHAKKSGNDYLDFAATVWVGGNSPLDVEGFKTAGRSTMRAYQYYSKNGHIIGRTRAGTMGFDSKKGHNHWHFQQFAKYQLLNASKKVAIRSRKVGFCIAPTDAVDMVLPHAAWQPFDIGLDGECGSPTALWVREEMPVGWGDTYIQSIAGQSFNITGLPNGTYYVKIIANPERVLHELRTSNDVSLRKVIISGKPGARHVRVPAFHGINPEK